MDFQQQQKMMLLIMKQEDLVNKDLKNKFLEDI
jgi:hypothetical protein